jgi:hypothetical protein
MSKNMTDVERFEMKLRLCLRLARDAGQTPARIHSDPTFDADGEDRTKCHPLNSLYRFGDPAWGLSSPETIFAENRDRCVAYYDGWEGLPMTDGVAMTPEQMSPWYELGVKMALEYCGPIEATTPTLPSAAYPRRAPVWAAEHQQVSMSVATLRALADEERAANPMLIGTANPDGTYYVRQHPVMEQNLFGFVGFIVKHLAKGNQFDLHKRSDASPDVTNVIEWRAGVKPGGMPLRHDYQVPFHLEALARALAPHDAAFVTFGYHDDINRADRPSDTDWCATNAASTLHKRLQRERRARLAREAAHRNGIVVLDEYDNEGDPGAWGKLPGVTYR